MTLLCIRLVMVVVFAPGQRSRSLRERDFDQRASCHDQQPNRRSIQRSTKSHRLTDILYWLCGSRRTLGMRRRLLTACFDRFCVISGCCRPGERVFRRLHFFWRYRSRSTGSSRFTGPTLVVIVSWTAPAALHQNGGTDGRADHTCGEGSIARPGPSPILRKNRT